MLKFWSIRETDGRSLPASCASISFANPAGPRSGASHGCLDKCARVALSLLGYNPAPRAAKFCRSRPSTGQAHVPASIPDQATCQRARPSALLIVTREDLVPEFERLVEWKTRRGVPAVVLTLKWVESRTRPGIDQAETLRNSLVDAHAWGSSGCCGGATSVIPIR